MPLVTFRIYDVGPARAMVDEEALSAVEHTARNVMEVMYNDAVWQPCECCRNGRNFWERFVDRVSPMVSTETGSRMVAKISRLARQLVKTCPHEAFREEVETYSRRVHAVEAEALPTPDGSQHLLTNLDALRSSAAFSSSAAFQIAHSCLIAFVVAHCEWIERTNGGSDRESGSDMVMVILDVVLSLVHRGVMGEFERSDLPDAQCDVKMRNCLSGFWRHLFKRDAQAYAAVTAATRCWTVDELREAASDVRSALLVMQAGKSFAEWAVRTAGVCAPFAERWASRRLFDRKIFILKARNGSERTVDDGNTASDAVNGRRHFIYRMCVGFCLSRTDAKTQSLKSDTGKSLARFMKPVGRFVEFAASIAPSSVASSLTHTSLQMFYVKDESLLDDVNHALEDALDVVA